MQEDVLKIRKVDDSINRLEDQVDTVRQKMSNLDARIASFSKTIKTDYTNALIDKFQSLEEVVSHIEDNISSTKKIFTQQETMMNSLFEEIKYLQSEVIRQNERLQELKRSTTDLESRIFLIESKDEDIKDAARRLREV
mgnify:CR=1 FL=1